MAAVTAYAMNYATLPVGSMESGGAETAYPATNLTDEFSDTYVKTTSTTNITFKVAFTTNQTVGFVGIINHNFSGGTLTVRHGTVGSTYAGCAASEISKAVPASPQNHACMYISTTAVAHGVWWINLTQAGGSVTSADAFFKIGEVILGALTNFTSDPAPVREPIKKAAVVHEMQNGRKYVVRRGQSRSFNLSWNAISLAACTEIETLHNTLDGTATPFCVVLNTAGGSGRDVYYGRIMGEPEITHLSENYYDVSLQFEEESFG